MSSVLSRLLVLGVAACTLAVPSVAAAAPSSGEDASPPAGSLPLPGAPAPHALVGSEQSLPILTAVVTPDDPYTPAQLHVIQRGNRTVWLDWNEVAGASAYKIKTVVYANPDNVTPTSVGVPSVDFANSAGKVAGLTNGVTYAFSVASVVSGKTSAYSPVVVSAPNPAGQPTDFHVTDQGFGRVNFDWLPVDRATGYKLKAVVLDAHGIASPAAGTARIDLLNSLGYMSGLTNGVTYAFTVSAVVDGQEGPPSAQLPATALAVPNAPGTPAAVTNGVTATAVSLSWTASTVSAGASAVSGYRIEAIPTAVGDTVTVSTVSNSGTVSGLTKGMSYRFKVAAVNSAGKGLWSPTRTYTATSKPGVVRDLSATRTPDGTQVDLDWLAPSNTGGQDPTSYQVTSSPVGGAIGVDTKNTSARVVGLDRATTYKYTVKSVNDSGASLGVTVGILADQPSIDEDAVIGADGRATLSFAPMDDEYLDYQAQAFQQVRSSSQLMSTVYMPADSIDCSPTLCTASWDNFGSYVNGSAWAFRVRATNGIDTYSPWSANVPPAPADAASLVQPVYASGQWTVRYTADWAQRASLGVYSMSVNGALTSGGSSGQLGSDPGEVVVELAGLGGQSQTVFNLASPEPPAPDVKVGDKGAAGGTVVYVDAVNRFYYESSPAITSHGPWQDSFPGQAPYSLYGLSMFGWANYAPSPTGYWPAGCAVGAASTTRLPSWDPTLSLSDALGAGPANTSTLLSTCASLISPTPLRSDGVSIARDYSQGGKEDWFIPSKGDLEAAMASGGVQLPTQMAVWTSSLSPWNSFASFYAYANRFTDYNRDGSVSMAERDGWISVPLTYGGMNWTKGAEMRLLLFRKQAF